MLPPAGPSCSKWFSCSCCSSGQASQARDFFSSNSRESILARPSAQEQDESAEDGVDESHAEPTPTRLSTLPLPPKLPWSPASLPFQRHLDALSTSLLASDPDESWRVYTGLHSSLRRYIPDPMFRDLVAQQGLHSVPKQAWSRIRSLLKLAHTCGMAYRSLGRDAVLTALRAGLDETARDDSSVRDVKLNYSILRQLWTTYRELHGGPLCSIDRDLRAGWLLLPRPSASGAAGSSDPLFVEIDELASHGAAADLGEAIGKGLRRKADEGAIEPALQRLVWCWENGVDVPDTDAEALLDRFEPDILPVVTARIVRNLALCPSSPHAVRLRRCAHAVILRRGGLEHIVPAMLSDPDTPARDVEAASMALLDEAGPTPSLDIVRLAFDGVKRAAIDDLALFAELLNRVAASTTAAQLSDDPIDPKRDAFLLDFARFVVRSHVGRTLPHLLPYHRHNLCSHLIRLADQPGAYDLAREMYSAIRADDPPFIWSEETRDDWRRLFSLALDQPKQHLHFASRLYEDLQADGMTPDREDAISLIHAISHTQSASRPILLERYIRDYLAHDYGHIPDLIDVLVDGLTRSGDARSAMTALNLALRLRRDNEPISPASTIKLVHVLAMCPERRAQDSVRSLLAELPDDTRSSRPYNIALASIIKQASTASAQAGEGRLDMLRAAVVLYRDMVRRGLRPGPQPVSLLIRGLVDCKRLDNALDCLFAALTTGIIVKSGTVGRLLVALANESRFDDADKVLAMWEGVCARSSAARSVWRKGIVGARVMLDVKRGKEVDLAAHVGQHGWQPNESFARWVRETQDAQRPQKGVGVQIPSSALDGQDLGAEAEVEEQGPLKAVPPREEGSVRNLQQASDGAELARYTSYHSIPSTA